MELKLKKEFFNVAELMFENTSEQSLDGDITLPDYCPDVKRILKCMVTPCVISEQCVGDRISIDANALVQVIYVDENNNIFCYDKTFPFSKNIETGKQIDNPVLEVRMKTAYANTRAVSSRRIDIHASVAISVSVTARKEIEVLTDAENCGIQLLKNFNNASDFVGQTVKNFTLNEVMEISKTKSPVKQIIRQKVVPLISEVKVISNKLLLKGEALISVLYCADTKEGGYELFENSLPLSQIIELDGINENTDYLVRTSVSSVNIIPKPNSSGEKKLLDVTAVICSVIKADKKVNLSLPCDCYSTIYNVKCDKKLITFDKIFNKSDDLMMIKETEEISNTSISQIINVWCDDVITTYTCMGNELKIIGSTNVSILGIDNEGQPIYVERTITFEKNKTLEGCHKDIICASDGVVSGIGFVLVEANKIDLRIEIRLNTTILVRSSAEIITDILCDNMIKEVNCSALTVYFTERDELLWNIARKYNTTVDAIASENDIKNNMISEKCMLLIPRV